MLNRKNSKSQQMRLKIKPKKLNERPLKFEKLLNGMRLNVQNHEFIRRVRNAVNTRAAIYIIIAILFMLIIITFGFEFVSTDHESATTSNQQQTSTNNNKQPQETTSLEHCNPETEFERFLQAGGAQETGCPNNLEWMKQFAFIDPSPQKNIVVIGCNKGLDAIDLFSQYDNSQSPFNSDIWREHASAHDIRRGACNQIRIPSHLDRKNHDEKFEMISPTVYCVEPMPSNFNLLKSIGKETKINQDSFKIMQYAVGNVTMSDGEEKFVKFPNAQAGSEAHGLQNAATANESVNVKFTSLDILCKDFNRIDILSIDTEGNDADVMYAGRQTLIKTRYLEFEVHRDFKNTSWHRNTLYDVIFYLDELKFDCFWSNNFGKLFQITNCWSSEYEKQAFKWSNVMCIKRNDIWHSVIKSIYDGQK